MSGFSDPRCKQLAQAGTHATLATREHDPSGGTAKRSPRQRVLIVDDHADTRHMLTILVQRWRYAAVSADSVAQAVETAKRTPCDMLICDLGLPDGSGLDIMTRLPKPIPAIILSGRHLDAQATAALPPSCYEHLVKPVDFDRLHAALQRLSASAAAMAEDANAPSRPRADA